MTHKGRRAELIDKSAKSVLIFGVGFSIDCD
jgi:hypothetical protein